MKKYLIALSLSLVIIWTPCFADDDEGGEAQAGEASESVTVEEDPAADPAAVQQTVITPVVTPTPPPPEDEDPDAPIDGGLSLLIAGGIGYGARKIYRAKNKAKETQED
jgi:hypothetical protein